MATLTIRNVDAAVKEELRMRAARNGRSMEAELRALVSEAVGVKPRDEVNLRKPSAGASRHSEGLIILRPIHSCRWAILPGSTDDRA